ncbi:MAG: asparagine synthase (glutamine-hydrolyzing) [Nitrospiraceae bacterium]|nr:asparagine synthase (glutamine-hydrolyzing) [Nitrospiraceae bacterium]
MCGIAGYIDFGENNFLNEAALLRMTNALAHRGPDDEGIWLDKGSGVALGHRRLSILDISPSGHQPMHSSSGRYVIVFNGEIYNHNEIRGRIDENGDCKWRGHSDTECMLAAIEKWGLLPAVKGFVGMFAFALWDREERVLSLVRDRLGEKPLYYGWSGRSFLFGSELKALRAHPAWRGEINRDALALLLRHNYIPAPYSIFRDVSKLLPGTVLNIRADGVGNDPAVPKPYWSAREIAELGSREPYGGTENEAIERLDCLLRSSIKQQMVADVPLGAFLSGGVDSSTIVALMQAQSPRPVKSFTIGFQERDFDEAQYAKVIALHLGTDHAELYVTPKDALEVIPRLPELYDEPFSDSSQIPTFLISRLARRSVTVSLSGDAGDELFAGYGRYRRARSIWGTIGWMPMPARRAAATVLAAMPQRALESILSLPGPALPERLRRSVLARRQKVMEFMKIDNRVDMYLRLVSHWAAPEAVVVASEEPPTRLTDRASQADLKDFTQTMLFLDLVSYLPDDILVKVDRAAMGTSLETRLPFLDHRVVEFAWKVPVSMKIRNGGSKWLLRQVLYKYVPPKLIERPKAGFKVPIGGWLRGPLRAWAEDLLDAGRLKSEGYLNPLPVRRKWSEHLAGNYNRQYCLWNILMFQAWLGSLGKG